MRRRLYAVIAVAALGLTMPSSAEEPKKLDGKKVTKIEVKGNGGTQQHDEEFVLGGDERRECKDPRCLRVDFIFAPDKVVGTVEFRIAWQNEHSDMDLYVVDKDNKEVATCGWSAGTGEVLAVESSKLTSGAKYTLIADYYRSFGDEVTATISFPGTYKSSETVPTAAEEALFLHANCGLDA